MSTHDDPTLDDRLARLAPTAPPDPGRFAAALDALHAEVAAEAAGGPDAGSGPPPGEAPDGARHRRLRSVRTDDSHVLDLDAPADVVTPLGAARGRGRRRRRLVVAAASVGVLGVAGAALVLSPVGPDLGPAAPERACASLLEAGMPGGAADGLSWRTLVSESRDGSGVVLVHSDVGELTGLCERTSSGGDTTTTTTTWPPVADDAPGPDEVRPSGVSGEIAPGGSGWFVAWGLAGADARNLRLLVSRNEYDTDGSRRREAGTLVEVDVADGRWAVALRADEVLPEGDLTDDGVPDDVEVTFLWSVDGKDRSLPLDAGWHTDTYPSNPLVQARRNACAPHWRGVNDDLVLEKRRGDHGVTMVADESTGFFTACVQDAAPPYTPVHTVSGERLPAAPGPDEAAGIVGGATAGAATLVGRAGEDVARVEVRTAGGATIRADRGEDGFWVAWTTATDTPTGDDGFWGDATLTWFLRDGSKGGSERVFE